jgi:hypothetical protein
MKVEFGGLFVPEYDNFLGAEGLSYLSEENKKQK